MASFKCQSCGDIITKKKIDSHLDRCWSTSFSCLNCQSQVGGQDCHNHVSCVTGDENHPGRYHSHKRQKSSMEFYHPPMLDGPHTPYQAYVRDIDDENSPLKAALAEVHVPPRAPSPPSATLPPINVFDFLVSGPGSPSSVSSVSSYATDAGEDSDVSMSPEHDQSPILSRSPTPTEFTQPNGQVYSEALYTYGSGPIEASNERFESHLDLDMQLQRYEPPSDLSFSPLPAELVQTPAPVHAASTVLQSQLDSRSDKKRKRPPLEELDLTNTASVDDNQSRALLHTSLTGGLMKLINDSADHSAEASPLSPKKRSKHSRNVSLSKLKSPKQKVERSKRQKEHKDKDKDKDKDKSKDKDKRRHRSRHVVDDDTPSGALVSKEGRRSRKHQQRLLLEGRKEIKAIEYYPLSAQPGQNDIPQAQDSDECHSAFFLRLVDKDHHSIKGQSLWGLLKMFHEGRCQTSTNSEQETEEDKRREERMLLKGLRAKISKNGEIVLFSRPEAEVDE